MKKIFIQSISQDRSTDDVIQWLNHLESRTEIINFFNTYEISRLDLEISNKLKIDVHLNDIVFGTTTNFWYRRGKFNFSLNDSENLNSELFNENIKPIIDFLNNGILSNGINKFNDNFKEKLEMLQTALLLKINIPDVLITSDYIKLRRFLKKHKKVITKPISNPSYKINTKNYKIEIGNQTQLLTIEDLDTEDSSFLPSFFQKYVDKKFEIRTFYLKGNFKSMAIFSQENEKTKIDFRNYDYERPNRCVPYLLPKTLERKLHKLMLKLNLNSGSFDLIFTPSGKYYFLEVNPIGQFQWLSQNCNYFIERMISKDLLNIGYE